MTTLHSFNDLDAHSFPAGPPINKESRYRRQRNLPRLYAVPEQTSGFRSPFDPDRMCSPLPRGRNKPSVMHTSRFRSLDPNFARTINDRAKVATGFGIIKPVVPKAPKKLRVNQFSDTAEEIDFGLLELDF